MQTQKIAQTLADVAIGTIPQSHLVRNPTVASNMFVGWGPRVR